MNSLNSLIGVVWGLLALIPLYWLFWPVVPVAFLDESTNCRPNVPTCNRVLNEGRRVTAGDHIRMQVSVQHLTEGVAVTVTPQMLGPEVRHFEPFNYGTTGEVFNFVNASLQVPHSIQSGVYVVSFTSCFHLNPLRKLCMVRETEPFMVIASHPVGGNPTR